MTVKELIAQLRKEDQDRLVVMAMDSEGNGYSKLYEIFPCAYGEDCIGLEELTDEDIEAGYGSEDVLEDGEPALPLRP